MTPNRSAGSADEVQNSAEQGMLHRLLTMRTDFHYPPSTILSPVTEELEDQKWSRHWAEHVSVEG